MVTWWAGIHTTLRAWFTNVMQVHVIVRLGAKCYENMYSLFVI